MPILDGNECNLQYCSFVAHTRELKDENNNLKQTITDLRRELKEAYDRIETLEKINMGLE